MTTQLASALVGRWVRFYTRDLPSPIAQRRVEELDADVHEQIAFERAHGAADHILAFRIVSRMVRGMPADVAWRRHLQPSKGDLMKPLAALLVAAIALAVAALVFDSPLLILLGVTALGALVLGTFALSARSALDGDFIVPLVAIHAVALGLAALGVIAIVVGDRGDAPGLVLFGVALITSVVVGAIAMGMRASQPRSR